MLDTTERHVLHVCWQRFFPTILEDRVVQAATKRLPVAKTTQLHIHRLDGIEQLVHTKASPDSSPVPVTAFPFETAGPAT